MVHRQGGQRQPLSSRFARQAETIARGLGVLFLFFHLGLDFGLGVVEKIREVWAVAVIGNITIHGIVATASVILGNFLSVDWRESIVVGSAIFLSSTALTMRSFRPDEAESNYGRPIVGILVMQDVMLGVLLAMMPALEASGAEAFRAIMRLLTGLVVFALFAALMIVPTRFVLERLRNHANRELFLLGCVAACLTTVLMSSYLGLSMELSSFVAGIILSTNKSNGERAAHAIEPFRDLFGALFFASVGLHIYPSFLLHQLPLLLLLTLLAVLFKIIVTFWIARMGFPLKPTTAATVAVGLGQISEYAFIFAARAKR